MVKSRSKSRITNRRSKSARTIKPLSSSHKNELGILGSILGFGALHSESESANNGEPNRQSAGSTDNIFMGGGDQTNVSNRTSSALSSKNQRKSLDVSILILTFMEMLNTIKIFHWSTLSYPSHIATDNLHTKMSELIDSFIEQYIGGVGGGKTPVFRGSRNHSIPFCECKSLEHLRRKLSEYKTFLNSLSERLNGVTELLNIRDEMISTIDQAVYLLRLK